MSSPDPSFTYRNWAQTFECRPELYFEPETEDEVVALVKRAADEGKVVKVFGAGHSPSDLPCSDGYMLNMDKMNKLIEIDTRTNTATFEAGVRLHEMHPILRAQGLALSVLGAISEQSLAGAIATGTHGTGIQFGNLSSSVRYVRLVNGCGRVMDCSPAQNADVFAAARCHIGALGIVTRVSIQCEPAFRLESVQEPIEFETMLDDMDQLVHAAQHTKFLWFPYSNKVVISKLNRTDKPVLRPAEPWAITRLKDRYVYELELYGTRFLPSFLPEVERWFWSKHYARRVHLVDDSNRVFNFDCMFRQYTNEWAIPIEHTAAAIRDLNAVLANARYPIHFPIEIRFVRRDDVWLSPSYGRDVCYIGVVMYKPFNKNVPYRNFWLDFERVMKSHDGRPHWAKYHLMSYEDLARVYPRLDDFLAVRRRLDPKNIFLNDYLKRHLLPGGKPEIPEDPKIQGQFANRPLKSKL
ncbi:D-arabinono-1,4-lactone oxidase [Tieghemiomyces parasiticus]|uniref:D-arabinono-1,4-lactone oxidase n=1 Tax=Tieghemiomyces parasiticus TaxID=78921 RepID=A0A9W8A9K3_9FUNG|nr:D-arabinono-1,4-lactone oxidase [Tieghemiomyces parasiticus]